MGLDSNDQGLIFQRFVQQGGEDQKAEDESDEVDDGGDFESGGTERSPPVAFAAPIGDHQYPEEQADAEESRLQQDRE